MTAAYINPKLPSMIRSLWKQDPRERSLRAMLNLAGDLIEELIVARACIEKARKADRATQDSATYRILVRMALAEYDKEASGGE